jgi:hypothetical protein
MPEMSEEEKKAQHKAFYSSLRSFQIGLISGEEFFEWHLSELRLAREDERKRILEGVEIDGRALWDIQAAYCLFISGTMQADPYKSFLDMVKHFNLPENKNRILRIKE